MQNVNRLYVNIYYIYMYMY